MGATATGIVGCASSAPGADQAKIADTITRAVYANDYDATTANFDDATKKTVTRSDLGELSDRMHALGDYQSLSTRSASPDTGKYEFDAVFTGGTMVVELRIDPDGKIGAYRVVPPVPRAAQSGSSPAA